MKTKGKLITSLFLALCLTLGAFIVLNLNYKRTYAEEVRTVSVTSISAVTKRESDRYFDVNLDGIFNTQTQNFYNVQNFVYFNFIKINGQLLTAETFAAAQTTADATNFRIYIKESEFAGDTMTVEFFTTAPYGGSLAQVNPATYTYDVAKGLWFTGKTNSVVAMSYNHAAWGKPVVYIEFAESIIGAYSTEATKALDDTLFVNGVALKTVKETVANAIAPFGWNQGGKKQTVVADVKTAMFKFDGNDTVTIKAGTYIADGAVTTEDVTFRVVKTGETSMVFLMDKGENTVNRIDYTTAWGDPSLYIKCATTVAGAYESNASAVIGNYIVINGKTMNEINAEHTGYVSVWHWSGVGANSTTLHVKVNRNIFKWDGTDTITVKAGLYTGAGTTISNTFTTALQPKTETTAICYANGHNEITEIRYSAGNGLFVFFEKVVNGTFTGDANALLLNDLKINGKSCKEMNDEKSGTASVMGWNQGGNGGVAVWVKMPDSVFKLDGTDVITLPAGVYTAKDEVTTKPVTAIMSDKVYLLNDYTETATTTVKSVSFFKNVANDNHWIYVNFNDVTFQSAKDATLWTEALMTDVTLNGLTVSQILKAYPGTITMSWIGNKSQIIIYVKNSLNDKKIDNTVVFDTLHENELVIPTTLVSPDGLAVAEEFSGKMWYYYASNADGKMAVTVSYDANGGVGTTTATNGYYSQTVKLATNAFTKDKCEFKGWATTENGEVAYAQGADFKLEVGQGMTELANVTLYAVWGACEHNYGEWVAEVGATCTANGTKGHYTCSKCGYNFDAEYNEIESLTIEAGHKYGEWVAEVGATCTANGTKGHYTCEVCQKNFDAEYNEIENLTIEAGHKYGEWVAEVGATCTVNGTKGHYTCEVCQKNFDANYGEIENLTIEAGHKYGEWVAEVGATCTANGTKGHYTCEVCQKNFDANYGEIEDLTIEKANHIPSDWIIDKEATATEDGAKHKECTECHTVLEQETINKTGSGEESQTQTETESQQSSCTLGLKTIETVMALVSTFAVAYVIKRRK